MNHTFFERNSRWILLGVALLLPVIVFGALRALSSGANDVRQWLPVGFEETRQYDWFLSHFGSEEMAVVSWPGCTLDDERMDRVAAALDPSRTPPPGVALADERRLFKQVLTGRELLGELMGEPLELSEAQARRRLAGIFLGPDQQTSGLAVMISREGEANRHAALDAIYRAAREAAGIGADELRVGGPTVDSVALDRESARSRYQLAGLSVVFALLLAWRCLRRFRLVAVVFATAILASVTSVAIVYYTGHRMTLMLITMPTLIYVLAISGAIHLANYYRDVLERCSPSEAPLRALAAGWLPCTLTALTTAVGLGSLGVSEVLPVKLFGTYAAIGVLATLPFLFLFLPAVLQLWPLRPQASSLALDGALLAVQPRGWANWLAERVARRHALLLALSLAGMAVVGSGLLRLETSVRLLNLFSPQAKIIRDYQWLEGHLGPLVPVEVVLRMEHSDDLTLLERIELVGHVQRELGELEHVGGTLSAATFAPEVARGGGARQIAQRRIVEKRVEQGRERFEDAHLLRATDEGELWRISARIDALGDVDYGYFLERVQESVQPVLDQYAAGGVLVDATYTGVVPLVYKAQRELLGDLMRSFAAAFVLVGVVMIVTLRQLVGGLLVMLPNLFPAVVVFGLMGWSGQLLDIGAMMTASVALGIAVDDTIHFMSWFRRGLKSGLTRVESVALAYRSCAGAMVQTTIVCGLGLLVFSLSSFVPTSNFAFLMCAMLVTALVGDLIFLPALLIGPLGRFFEQRPAPAMPLARRVRRGRAWARALRTRRAEPAIAAAR